MASIDALTSATLKHLREAWWDDAFTEFLAETLRPRPGNRILDVGCGEGLAEVEHRAAAHFAGAARRHRPRRRRRLPRHGRRRWRTTSASDLRRPTPALPFKDGAFDSIYCVAVLQHIDDGRYGRREFARVTTTKRTRAWLSSPTTPRGMGSARRRWDGVRSSVGAVLHRPGRSAWRSHPPSVRRFPSVFARHGIEPLAVRLFPVSQTMLGPPPPSTWQARREAVESALEQPPRSDAAAWLGREYLDVLTAIRARSECRRVVLRRDSEHDAVRDRGAKVP